MKLRKAFTIVEIAAVIAVLAILTTITIVGYGGWRNRAATNDVKNELTLAAAAMKAELVTNNTYPMSISSSYKGGRNVTVTYGSGDVSSYCLDGASKTVPSIRMYIKNNDLSPTQGTCATGPIVAQSGGPLVYYAASANQYTTCVLASDSTPYCTGESPDSTVLSKASTSPVLSGVTGSVVRGYISSCAVNLDSILYCWGQDINGVLGRGTSSATIYSAGQVLGALQNQQVSSIAVGGETSGSRTHACAISNGTIYCWGNNNFGQLGNGTTTGATLPSSVIMNNALNGKTPAKIYANSIRSCVITSSADMYCWGNNSLGLLGDGTTTQRNEPTIVAGTLSGKYISSVSLSPNTTCIVSMGQAYCWGTNTYGQVGNGTTVNTSTPNLISSLPGSVVSITNSPSHTCALTSTNQIYCWGYNGEGALGNGTTTNSSVPVAVDMSGALSGKTVLSVTVGYSHTCASVQNGGVFCWGGNIYGQLGDGTTTNRLTPVAMKQI